MTVMLSAASRRLGRYELSSYLGSGGMSDVYAAVHVGLRKRVALKMLRPALRQDTQWVQRFLREGECAARVCHPNVVDVSDVGVEQGIPYLVMELLEGETLARTLEREGALELTCAIDLLLPIVDAVVAAHAAGVLHRDIKPANILLARSSDGRSLPKLVDFGIAVCREHMGDVAEDLGLVGTPQYMSPEQARAERVDERSDQYSLASVLFEMLTGRPPFAGGSVEEVIASVARGRFPRASSLQAALPTQLDEVLARATAKLPAQRYDSVDDLAQALVSFASESTRSAWSARQERSSLASVQQLSGEPHKRSGSARDRGDSELASSPLARGAVRFDRAPRSLLRSVASTAQRVAMGAALLGLGVGAGLGVTRGEAEEPKPPEVPTSQTPNVAVTEHEQPRAAPIVVHIYPRQAKASLDGVVLAGSELVLPALDESLHELRVTAPGHIARVVLFRGELHEPTITLERTRR
jgi:serine/threonine protein kinase